MALPYGDVPAHSRVHPITQRKSLQRAALNLDQASFLIMNQFYDAFTRNRVYSLTQKLVVQLLSLVTTEPMWNHVVPRVAFVPSRKENRNTSG